MNPQVCYAPRIRFKPEWAYAHKPGMRAESFVYPFNFNVVANNVPQENFAWRLDDDVPYVIRGILFPEIGTAEQGQSLPGQAAMVRIRDGYGNPLTNCLTTNDYVLALGAAGQSGFGNLNGGGFPFPAEVYCERGSIITFDFQIPGDGSSVLVIGTLIGAKLYQDC